MEEHTSLADIKAHLDAQLARRAEQRASEPGGQAIARQRAGRALHSEVNKYAIRPQQMFLSPLAHRGIVLMGVEANYIASADTMRAKGISEFITALVDPQQHITFDDTRPIELRKPEFGLIPNYASPERLNYRMWWEPRIDRMSDVEHWRIQRLFKLTDATVSHIIHIALLHEIAAPDRIHRTWDAITTYCATHPTDSASAIHRHPLALSQAGAVLEVIGLGYLTPSFLPHSNKVRRYRRKPLTDLDFF